MADSVTSSPSVSFRGFATGLDSQSIIDALVGVKRVQVDRINARKAKLQKQQTDFNTLRTKLEALRTKADAVRTDSKLSASIATSSEESVLTVSADGTASPGTHAINVTKLAKAESRGSTGVADAAGTKVGSGTILVTVGSDAYEVSVGADSTLEDIRDAFNSSGAPLKAVIINDGSTVSPNRLVITANQTGASNAFSLDLGGFTANLAGFTISQLNAGQDAEFTVDGIAVKRPTNSTADVLTGVTLNFKDTGSSDITVEHDPAAVKKRLDEFLGAYNDVVDFVKAQSNFNERDGRASLYGDAILTRTSSNLRTVLTSAIAGADADYDRLSDIGVRTDVNGKLSIDADDFNAALADDYDSVIDLFTTASTGLSAKVADQVSATIQNSLLSRNTSINDRIRGLNDEVTAAEARIERYAEQLKLKYARLEQFAGRYQSQGSTLGSIG